MASFQMTTNFPEDDHYCGRAKEEEAKRRTKETKNEPNISTFKSFCGLTRRSFIYPMGGCKGAADQDQEIQESHEGVAALSNR